jgi:hypothetical protein
MLTEKVDQLDDSMDDVSDDEILQGSDGTSFSSD